GAAHCELMQLWPQHSPSPVQALPAVLHVVLSGVQVPLHRLEQHCAALVQARLSEMHAVAEHRLPMHWPPQQSGDLVHAAPGAPHIAMVHRCMPGSHTPEQHWVPAVHCVPETPHATPASPPPSRGTLKSCPPPPPLSLQAANARTAIKPIPVIARMNPPRRSGLAVAVVAVAVVAFVAVRAPGAGGLAARAASVADVAAGAVEELRGAVEAEAGGARALERVERLGAGHAAREQRLGARGEPL